MTTPITTRITDHVVDVIRYLAAFTATGELTDIGAARHRVAELARHELCGLDPTITRIIDQESACEHRCGDIALPLFDVTLYIQRALGDFGGDE